MDIETLDEMLDTLDEWLSGDVMEMKKEKEEKEFIQNDIQKIKQQCEKVRRYLSFMHTNINVMAHYISEIESAIDEAEGSCRTDS